MFLVLELKRCDCNMRDWLHMCEYFVGCLILCFVVVCKFLFLIFLVLDGIFIDKGAKNVWTTWIPLDDVNKNMGPVSVLPGSHDYGLQQPLVPMSGAGGQGIPDSTIDQLCLKHGLAWATSDFNVGDILMFHSHTIHKGNNNNSNFLRLSCDFRYQSVNQPIVQGSLQPHWGRTTWDQIYQNWDKKTNYWKYYWKKYQKEIKYVPFDSSYTITSETGAH